MVAAVRRHRWLLLLLAAALGIGWHLADLEAWAEDEAGTLWQASDIASGHWHRLGLSSSTGIRNMIGAALLAVPLTWLPDLLSISRALALAHLLALCSLGLLIGRTPVEQALVVALLWFSPALMLSSFSLWNQYLARLIAALLLALLVYLVERRGSPRQRTAAVLAYVGLALLQPAVHLVHFPDLAVHLLLLAIVLSRFPARFDSTMAMVGAIAIGLAVPALYLPWLIDTAAQLTAGQQLLIVALAAVTLGGGAAVVAYWPRRLFDRVLAVAPPGTAAVVAATMLWIGLPAAVLSAIHGTAVASRLAGSSTPVAIALPVAQLALAVALLISVVDRARTTAHERAGLSRLYGARAPTAALLLSYVALLTAGRFLVGAAPWQRGDLWVSMIPAFLTPALLLAQVQGRLVRPPALAAVAASVVLLGALALHGLDAADRRAYPTVVPASEMRHAVDVVAARHRAEGGGERVDLSYDLAAGKAWIPRLVTWHPAFRWYSIGRPYDWLLRRRHGLRNLLDGEVERTRGGALQLGFRAAPYATAEWDVIERFDRLELRQRR